MSVPGLFSQPAPSTDDSDPILDAALDVFADIGVRRATVDEVAQRAGVGRVTVYRRIGGKNEILAAVMIRESQRLYAAVGAAAAAADSFEDRVVHAFATTVTTVRSNRVWNRLLELEATTVLDQLTVNASTVLAGAVAATAEVLRGPDMSLDDDELLARAEILVRITHSILLTPRIRLPLGTYEDVEAFARRHLVPIAALPT
ncbi:MULTISPECIES: TetR/AcrR family transcriptional regulator [unclassified Gordonia (in: high G+C Gram-positive bacteria)]|uniref:TetR/AcrR family transcriptional regulator n=1 Tax=unclassified Gordonia (in: high G+C Gram-positive bacteria) TaxID=2657482 RepID=UPI001F111BB1|nr:TetR/AcrR family transcriptional regulator [Gordonia sp. ABSL49_1]MCH5643845.1 TetR/AcrR family transcriptional regulator [Gordonia sp. ABSL49_1]